MLLLLPRMEEWTTVTTDGRFVPATIIGQYFMVDVRIVPTKWILVYNHIFYSFFLPSFSLSPSFSIFQSLLLLMLLFQCISCAHRHIYLMWYVFACFFWNQTQKKKQTRKKYRKITIKIVPFEIPYTYVYNIYDMSKSYATFTILHFEIPQWNE